MESARQQETKLDEIKGKIEEYREAIEANKIKVTLKDSDEMPIPQGFTLQPKKTVIHKDATLQSSGSGKKGSKDEGTAVAINCVTFNQNERFVDQFATVDDQSCLCLWDAKKGIKVCEE